MYSRRLQALGFKPRILDYPAPICVSKIKITVSTFQSFIIWNRDVPHGRLFNVFVALLYGIRVGITLPPWNISVLQGKACFQQEAFLRKLTEEETLYVICYHNYLFHEKDFIKSVKVELK